jgi:hypothetical protein
MSCIDKCEKCLKVCITLSCNGCETAILNFGAVEQFETGDYTLHLRNMVTGVERVYSLTAVYDVLSFDLTDLNGFGNEMHPFKAVITYEGEAVTMLSDDGTPYTCLDITFEFKYDNNGNIQCQEIQVV